MRPLLLAVFLPLTLPAQHWPVTLTAEDGPDQSITIHLKNEHYLPLTAYLVGYRHGGARNWNVQFNWMDVAMNSLPNAGTAPGQAAEIKIAKSSVPAADWTLQAVIFADGTVAGDADAVNEMLAARAHTYQDIEKAISMLTRTASVTDFVTWRKASVPIPMPPARMSLPAGSVVPQSVVKLFNDGKSDTEIRNILNDWRDRLAAVKPAIPTKSRPERGAL